MQRTMKGNEEAQENSLCSFNLLFTFSTHWNLVSASTHLLLMVSLLRSPGLRIDFVMGQTSIFILFIFLDATNLVLFLEISLYSVISDCPSFPTSLITCSQSPLQAPFYLHDPLHHTKTVLSSSKWTMMWSKKDRKHSSNRFC